MVMLDPPEHTAFRKLVARGFTPRAVREIEPAVRAYVVERLERLRAEGGGDIVAELFKPLPSMVVAHYLGVPDDGRERFDAWSDAIVSRSSAGEPLEGLAAIGELMAYFAELVERRRVSTGQRHGLAPGGGRGRRRRPRTAVDPGLRLHHGHRRQRHHDRQPRRRRPAPGPPPRPARGAGRRPGAGQGRGGGAAAAHLAGAGAGPHDDPRRRAARRHHPGRPQGAALLRRRQPRPAPLRRRRGRARHPPEAQPDPDLQPGQPPLHRRRGRADAGRGGPRGAGHPHPDLRRRLRRGHLGARPLRAPAALRPPRPIT